MADVFMSYTHVDAKTALLIAGGIEDADYKTWYYERDSVLGSSHLIESGEEIERADAFILLISTASVSSREITSELIRASDASKLILPVLLDLSYDEFKELQPAWRQILGATVCTCLAKGNVDEVIQDILAALENSEIQPAKSVAPAPTDSTSISRSLDFPASSDSTPPTYPEGIAPRNVVFGKEELPGQVFAIELLKKPVWLRREGDQAFVTISREEVDFAVFTNHGKRKIVERTLAGEGAKERAQELDRTIHRFLLHQTDEQELRVEQPNLRWASGGVLTRIRYRDGSWMPLFFRDIPPYGWNICLGASEEKNDNLNDPWSFVMREFLEETLVCRRSERGSGTAHRAFVFDREKITEDEEKRAQDLSRKHQRLRYDRDGIALIQGDSVHVDLENTKTQLQIVGQAEPLWNVLVCFNITELGIEVLKVISYELAESDYILDGEIYEPGRSEQLELVRMPVALISEEFLENAFGGNAELEYQYEDPLIPSILSPEIPAEHIHIFEQDVVRRRDIALEKDANATDWERERYTFWYKKFGRNFLDSEDRPTNTNANRLFTPTSAKALSYYFVDKGLKR
jgi:hypothetical protein